MDKKLLLIERGYMKDTISMEQIYTEGTIQFFQIDRLKVHAAVNEHGTMTISGILKR